mgnify:CR=1 FL=1
MWNIKQIKRDGRKLFKNNVWTLMFLGLFVSVVIGSYMLNNDGFSNFRTLYHYITNKDIEIQSGQTYFINEYVDKVISQILTGNVTGLINDYNERNNISKGVVYSIFNVITKGQQQLQNTINSIRDYQGDKVFQSVIFIIASIMGIGIRIFLVYPIKVGESRIYLESINYKKTKIRRIMYAFKKERYIGTVKALLLMEVKKFLWNLTIIGGIVKNYSYKMVIYIIAENPKITAKEAIQISEEMMKENKFQAFKLDVSFLGWSILQYVTFGILGIYVAPYYTSTYTELYHSLREEYIREKKYHFELLNDNQLFEENELEKYPDEYETQRKKIIIDYDKKYELSSIILFFFIFSFIGWIWEVALYLFRDGILVNRGALYGPWLPIYGTGCTIIILLTRFKKFRKILKNPILTFLIITLLCTTIEYFTSYYLELIMRLKYWDYTGVFLNLNGRVCLECSLFFGLGGSLSIYIVAPYLERQLVKLSNKNIMLICIILILLFTIDTGYSIKHPHIGEYKFKWTQKAISETIKVIYKKYSIYNK